MTARYWPIGVGRIVTSPYGPRAGGIHRGVDFGRPGGSGGMPVYAVQSGTVIHSGAAQGYGSPDPCGWLVVESEGGEVWEYGHIVREPDVRTGSRVVAGQKIATINPNVVTNGGVAPHLHLSWMPRKYNPAEKADPMPVLAGAKEPESSGVKETLTMPAAKRPDYNEYWVSSPNFHNRGGTRVDLFLLHTQEGNGNADSLARYLADSRNKVSYHYTVHQAADGGVTVCDVVDTDYASWSVLSANNRSINLCFAGSSASWTREQWMKQSKAIEVAAWLAAQDCIKYKIPIRVIPPPYTSPPPGISDHRYVTKYLGDGNHTDVGDRFPWDFFIRCVEKFTTKEEPVVKPAEPPNQPPFRYPSRDEMILQIWEQMFGPRAQGWPQLGGKTLVDAVAEIIKNK